MNKAYLLLLAFFIFSCSSSDDATVVEEEDLNPIEEESKVYKLKKETFSFEDYYMTEREINYEYNSNGFISKIIDKSSWISGSEHESITDYFYNNNRLDSIVNIYVQTQNTSKSTTVFTHDLKGDIISSSRYYNERLVELMEYFYKTNNQLDYTVSTRVDNDGEHQTPKTEYLIYENGILVGYESAFPTTRTFDNKNNPHINLYSPDYKRIAKDLFINNTLTQVSTSSSVKRKYEYEYNSDNFPVKSLNYEDDKLVFEKNYIYY